MVIGNKTSCIEHPARQNLVIIREDYLAICGGDDCPAVILNYFEHWHNSKLDTFEQWRRECEVAEKNNESLPPEPETWVYATQEQIRFDLLYTYGERKVADGTEWLVEVGFLLSRSNPNVGFDRTKQYLFNVEFIQLAIREIADSIGAKLRNGKVQIRGMQRRKSAGAIPKTHSETPNIDIAPSGARGKRITIPAAQMNPMKDAIFAAFGHTDWNTLTSAEAGVIQKTSRELCLAGYTPADVAGIYDYCKNNFDNFGPRALSTNASSAREDGYLATKEATSAKAVDSAPQDDEAALQAARERSRNRFNHMREGASHEPAN